MAWKLFRWVWRLESPLHIGAPPAGALNRTRLYVPARALWGALTAELARTRGTSFPNYRQVGDQLKKETRLIYLYPAEEVEGRWKAWLPRYQEGAGLVWEREDKTTEEEPQGDRKFRIRLLSTCPGTAIAPESDTAHEGTLREFELVGPYWRDGSRAMALPVGLVGYLFVNAGQSAGAGAPQLAGSEIPKLLFVGGDTRYGLGRICHVECQSANDLFGCPVDLNQNDPVVKSSRVLAHALTPTPNNFKGQYERVVGWDYNDQLQLSSEMLLQPGSKTDQDQSWKIQDTGHWKI